MPSTAGIDIARAPVFRSEPARAPVYRVQRQLDVLGAKPERQFTPIREAGRIDVKA
jgi:hypothetical protein